MHKFDPSKFQAKKQAKQDHESHKQTNPSPSSVPALAQRVKLLELLLGV